MQTDLFVGLLINRRILHVSVQRGWTVWSLAATDRRVVVMTPFVFSLLNMEEVTVPFIQFNLVLFVHSIKLTYNTTQQLKALE